MLPTASGTSPTPPVLRPSLAILGGLAGALLGSIVARGLMARALAPAELGAVVFALAVASALGGAASLGVNPAVGRRIAALRAAADEAGARRAARTAAALALGCGTLAGVALLAAAPLLARLVAGIGAPADTLAGALGGVAPIAWALPAGLAAVGISRGFGRAAGRSLIRDGGGGLFRAAAVATAVALGFGVGGVTACFAVAVVAAEGLFLLWCAAQGWLGRPAGTAAGSDRTLLSGLRPFALLEVLGQAGQWIDLLVLGALAPPAAVGFFGVAKAVHRALEMTLQAPSHAFLPSAADAARRGDDELFARVYRRSRMVALALLWLPLGISLLAPELPVTILAGREYAPAAGILRLLALVVLLQGAGAFMEPALVARGLERAVAVLQGASVVLALVLLLVLVPAGGGTGAALALLATALVRVGGMAILVVRSTPLRRLADHLPAPLAGALAVTAVTGLVLFLAPGAPQLLHDAVAVAGSGAAALVLAAGLLRPSEAGGRW